MTDANGVEADSTSFSKISLNNGESAAQTARKNYLSWNDFFMGAALLSAQRSKDPKTQVGACIVGPDNIIVAMGYNGMPNGCDDNQFPWGKSDNPYENKLTYVVHAEVNAIMNKNTASLRGCRMYVSLFPCNECTKVIVQSGISEIFYLKENKTDRASKRMLDAAKIKYRQHCPEVSNILLDFS